MAAAFLMASAAGAEDPPIVSVGPVGSGSGAVSGTVGSDPQADACVGGEHSGADPADPTVVQLSDSNCASGSGSSTGGGVQGSGSGGTQASTGARPAGSSAGGSATRVSATATVSAGQAVGLRIVRVRHLTSGVRLTKRFGVLVTLNDVRGKRVRGAIVSVSRVPGSRHTVTGIQATFSNKLGQARLVVPVAKQLLGKRVFLKIAARTPSARAVVLRSVFLPKLSWPTCGRNAGPSMERAAQAVERPSSCWRRAGIR